MNENFSIRGLTDKNDLNCKTLQNMHIDTLHGVITSEHELDDLFEINIYSSVLNKSSLEFHDMNLNIFNCSFTFNIIGIDSHNNGVFFKYTLDHAITYKSFANIDIYKLLVLDCFFSKKNKFDVGFSLIIGLDFSKQTKALPLNTNPISILNNDKNLKINLFFDKEFI